ncbi:hypothetical protein I2I05_08585 [Hymenobacter sp. BT683]|uniref:Uncharacterized protein n=1 Tax=Hymenobacter jeongseonensis TaxID=2791027 RepID=A0ABS0IGG0_9BACT|nr:hypothetical protein [Hymenobacter jeongseonensis]MBF9237453.1 hypothetical protein [Hymenobacter jeongseonensis]
MPINTTLSITVSLNGNSATVNVLGAKSGATRAFTMTTPDGTFTSQTTNVFATLSNGSHVATVVETDAIDGTETTVEKAFAVNVPPAPSMTFQQAPAFLNAVYNPMPVVLRAAPYAIGDLFYVEVWSTPGKAVHPVNNSPERAVLLQTLRSNGDGLGTASFDISGVLQSSFEAGGAYVPGLSTAFQKDETCYQGFFVRCGIIRFDAANKEIKTQLLSTNVQFALRAAFPLATTASLTRYFYTGDDTIPFLTNLPYAARRKRSEPTLLGLFAPLADTASLNLNAELVFRDGTSEVVALAGNQTASGGVYLFTVMAKNFQGHPKYDQLKRFSVWVNQTPIDGTAFRLSDTLEITVEDDVDQPVTVLFMNRKGTWDSLHFNRDTDTTIKLKSLAFANGYGQRTYQVSTDTTLTYYSGWLTADEYEWLKDLMTSPVLYINGSYYRQEDATFEKTTRLGLFTIELNVKPANEENTIKL